MRSAIAEERFQSRLTKGELTAYLRRHPGRGPKQILTIPPPQNGVTHANGLTKKDKEPTRRPHVFQLQARPTVTAVLTLR